MKATTPLELELEARNAWYAFVEQYGLPDFIPLNPDEAYKDEWRGWVDFLGWNEEAYNQIEGCKGDDFDMLIFEGIGSKEITCNMFHH